MRASPEECDAMAALTRGVSWGYTGDGDNGGNGPEVSTRGCVVRSGGCACGEEAHVEEASLGEEGGRNCADDVSLSSSAAGGAAHTTALSTILTMSASVKRSRTCTLWRRQNRTRDKTFTHRHRLSNARFNSNDGFSVVAPMICTKPRSMNGINAS